MPTSFLDLPLELRDAIYKLILPCERETNGELSSVNTDTTYWEENPLVDNEITLFEAYNTPLPTVLEEVLRLGARLLRTCRQVDEEVAPYVYGQQQYLFYRARQALEWLDKIGNYQTHLRHVAIAGSFIPHEALDDGRQVQADMWASVLRKVPNITSLSCLTHIHVMRWRVADWSNTVWNNEAVLEAIRDLAHVRVMFIERATRVNGYDYSFWQSSLELAFDKPLLETLILQGHPIAGVKWYPEDYFDRLAALKHLTIRNGLRMQSGNSKVSNDFFLHVAPLRSFTWYGHYFTGSHQKAFTTRHGGTLQFLDLKIRWKKYPEDRVGQRLEESVCLESLTNMFRALPVLKAFKLSYRDDCARLLENMPRSLTVLDLNGGGTTGLGFPSTEQDQSLGHALRKLPGRCPQLAHVRLSMSQIVADKDQMGRCGTLSIHNHAALEFLSSKIDDTFVASCITQGCRTGAPMDPELTAKIMQCWSSLYNFPISEIDLNRPWEHYYASLETIKGSK